jgi:threonine dehydrogenase-like Zn-dependent dehydrogenase
MRAAVLLAANQVEIQERRVPIPGDDEVLIRVGSVGVCGSDVHYYKERRIGPFVVESPLILGHEVGGRIVAVGRAVDHRRIDERVAIEPQRPDRNDGAADCAGVRRGRSRRERPVADRREGAVRFGATCGLDPTTESPETDHFDAFFDCCGTTAVVSGLGALTPAGRDVLVGTGTDEMGPPIPEIQNKELIVTGVFRYTDTWPAAIHLVASKRVALTSMVTEHFTLDQVTEALESTTRRGALKSVVRP